MPTPPAATRRALRSARGPARTALSTALAPLRPVVGDAGRWLDLAERALRRPTALTVLRELAADAATSGAGPDDDPVLVLAAGWRSGSTLVQRYLASDPELLVWGEPLTETDLVPRLARSLRPATPGYPKANRRLDGIGDPAQLHLLPIENLSPSVDDLLDAHRALLRRLFAAPAASAGRPRWGLKEVRFGALELTYLRLLFPDSRAVLLVRDPYAAWASYRGKAWWARWPDRPVVGAVQFGRLWRRLAGELVAAAAEPADRQVLVRYEDFVASAEVRDRVASVAGVQPDPATLGTTTSSTRTPPPAAEVRVLEAVVGPVARALGYEAHG